jgi:hypothetical protein
MMARQKGGIAVITPAFGFRKVEIRLRPRARKWSGT